MTPSAKKISPASPFRGPSAKEGMLLGEAGRTLGCRHAMLLARAFGDIISPDGDGLFAIGHDVRASSPSLAEAVSLGLRSGGHHVVHIGGCTTPRLEWYINDGGLHGGVMLTGAKASSEWNGMRLYGTDASPIAADAVLDAVPDMDLNRLFGGSCNPVLQYHDPLQAYTAHLRQRIKPAAHIKLCLDAGNSHIGNEIAPIVAHRRHLRLWHLGFEPDGEFPAHGPDPASPEALAGLAKCVRRNGCHLGAAMDPEGATLTVVDESGHAVAPSAIGALLALRLGPGYPQRPVLHGPDTPDPVRRALLQAGLTTRELDGGPSAAYRPLREGHASLYFDDTGHYAFCDFPGTANGLLALIELINYLGEAGAPLSQAVARTTPG